MNVRRNTSSPTAAGLEVVVVHGTRCAGRQLLKVVRMNTYFGGRSFAAAAPRVWNGLPDAVRDSALSEDTFAKLLKTYIMNCM